MRKKEMIKRIRDLEGNVQTLTFAYDESTNCLEKDLERLRGRHNDLESNFESLRESYNGLIHKLKKRIYVHDNDNMPVNNVLYLLLSDLGYDVILDHNNDPILTKKEKMKKVSKDA